MTTGGASAPFLNMKCTVQFLAKTGKTDEFTVSIGGETVAGVCAVEPPAVPAHAKAIAVIETIKREFPTVKLTDLEFEEKPYGTL